MITEERQQEFSTIPWRQIIGMRHKIIHEYFAVQTETVWDVVKNDIPTLREQIDGMIASLPDQEF